MNSYSELVKQFKKTGDGFDKIYNKINQSLYYFILGYVKNDDIAKDILSTTMLVVYNNIEKYNDELSEFNTWVFAIAKNSSLNHLKKAKKFVSLDAKIKEDSSSFSDLLEAEPILNKSKEYGIQKLFSEVFQKIDKTSVSGKILYFKHMKNFSNIEIAKELNIIAINKYNQLKNACDNNKKNINRYASLCIERDLYYKNNIYSESFIKNDLRKSYRLLRNHFQDVDLEHILI